MLISSESLTEMLDLQGFLSNGVESVAVLERFEANYADLVLRLQLTYSQRTTLDVPHTLVYKELGSRWYDVSGLPEIRFYTELAPCIKSSLVPILYGYSNDPEARRCALLLEDVSQDFVPATLPISDTNLELLASELARWHAYWWNHPKLLEVQAPVPESDVTRMAQALDATGLEENERTARAALKSFARHYAAELTPGEKKRLHKLESYWGEVFKQRVQNRQELTLLHGDFHLLGNIFFAREGHASVKAVDWAQAKSGLGPHDLMYVLISVPAPDRMKRDMALLKRYHAVLLARGVVRYSWAQCLWDYRFSLLTNLWQAVLQNSLHWFRKTGVIVEGWESDALLD